MKNTIFSSSLGYLFEGFIRQKQNEGFSYEEQISRLKNFDKYCLKNNITADSITKENLRDYLTIKETESKNSFYARFCLIRQFLIYMNARGIHVSIPNISISKSKPVPFLMTDEQVAAFISSVDKNPPKRNFNYSVFFRLLCTTGLRVNEALKLRINDYDEINKSLTVIHAKGNKDRIVYLADDMNQLLRTYLNSRKRSSPFIFYGNDINKPHTYGVVSKTFRKRWMETEFYANTGKNPTVHSLRHYFVIKRINLWASEGISINSMILYLSKHLGHASPNETYYYYHLINDSLKIMSKKDITGRKIMESIKYEEE